MCLRPRLPRRAVRCELYVQAYVEYPRTHPPFLSDPSIQSLPLRYTNALWRTSSPSVRSLEILGLDTVPVPRRAESSQRSTLWRADADVVL